MITAGYKQLLVQQHKTTKWGNEKGHRHYEAVAHLMEKVGANAMLDFGAGRGGMKNAFKGTGIIVNEYDPGIPGKDLLPDGTVDVVVSCDVLEHVEPQHLDTTLDLLFAKARKGLFLVIACRKAKAHLVDGTNAHLIVESPQWWLNMLWIRSIPLGWRTDFIHANYGKELMVAFIRPYDK